MNEKDKDIGLSEEDKELIKSSSPVFVALVGFVGFILCVAFFFGMWMAR